MSSFVAETVLFDVTDIKVDAPICVENKLGIKSFYSRQIQITLEDNKIVVIKMFSDSKANLQISSVV